MNAKTKKKTTQWGNEVNIITEEPGGLYRRQFPLTFGLPFSKGVLTSREGLPSREDLAIYDDKGSSLPLQTRIMEKHDDGSIRWLLIDFQGNFSPLTQSRHKLVIGERRALDVVTGYARNLAYRTNHYEEYVWGVGRESGWAMTVLGGGV